MLLLSRRNEDALSTERPGTQPVTKLGAEVAYANTPRPTGAKRKNRDRETDPEEEGTGEREERQFPEITLKDSFKRFSQKCLVFDSLQGF